MTRIIRPAARRDLARIWRFIARENSAAADAVVDAVGATIEQLVRHPLMGRVRPFRRQIEIRSQVIKDFPNYVIFYHPLRDGLEVKRILEGHQDIPRFFRH